MSIPTFTINLDKKCAECGKPGAAANGICLGCLTKAIQGKSMKSGTGKAAQRRARETLEDVRRR